VFESLERKYLQGEESPLRGRRKIGARFVTRGPDQMEKKEAEMEKERNPGKPQEER